MARSPYVPDPDEVEARVVAERAAQGLPPTIEDPELLAAGAVRCRQRMNRLEDQRGAA